VKRVAVTGATGAIGRAVTAALTGRGDQVVALSRDRGRAAAALGPGIEVASWSDPTTVSPPADALSGADVVVHLLGEQVAQRWTDQAKQRIRESRVQSTRRLVAALLELAADDRPGVLVSQSATGYYGARDDHELDERASAGSDFLAEVVTAWEREAQAAEPAVRVTTTRTGVVLSPSGGALAKMLPFFRTGVGGPVAGGRQYIPWIHLDDVVAGLLFCMDQAPSSGPVNLTSPNPVTNAEFSHALGRVLHRPTLLPVPGFALRLLYGEMAGIVITGQRVVPRRLEELGFGFRHTAVEPALRDVLGK
jgi:uncharacterized protein (TIGR01777 family)